MSQNNLGSQKDDETTNGGNSAFSINNGVSPSVSNDPSQYQQQEESRNVTPSSTKKQLTFGKDQEIEYSDSGQPSTRGDNSGGNVSRGREMSEGTMSMGPAMSEAGRSVAQSEIPPSVLARQMSEGAASSMRGGPAMSEGVRSVAQSTIPPSVMTRQMSEGAAASTRGGPAMSEGGRSVAQSTIPASAMTRQMSEGAAASTRGGPTMSEGGRSVAQSTIPASAMTRQMSEAAASSMRGGPTMSEAGRSAVQSAIPSSAQMFQSDAASTRGEPTMSQAGRSVPQSAILSSAQTFQSDAASMRGSPTMTEAGRTVTQSAIPSSAQMFQSDAGSMRGGPTMTKADRSLAQSAIPSSAQTFQTDAGSMRGGPTMSLAGRTVTQSAIPSSAQMFDECDDTTMRGRPSVSQASRSLAQSAILASAQTLRSDAASTRGGPAMTEVVRSAMQSAIPSSAQTFQSNAASMRSGPTISQADRSLAQSAIQSSAQMFDECDDTTMRGGPSMSQAGRNLGQSAIMSSAQTFDECDDTTMRGGPSISQAGRNFGQSAVLSSARTYDECDDTTIRGGPSVSQAGRNLAQSAIPSSAQMFQSNADRGGPIMSQMGTSLAQSAIPSSAQMFQSNAASMRGQPTISQMDRSLAQSAIPSSAQMFQSNAASMRGGPAMSQFGRSVEPTEATRTMMRQMTEGAQTVTNAPYNMQSNMTQQMYNGTSSLMPTTRDEYETIAGSQLPTTNAYMNSTFSEAQKNGMSGALASMFQNVNGENTETRMGMQLSTAQNSSANQSRPQFMDDAYNSQVQSLYNQQSSAIRSRTEIPAVAETQEDKEWISKFEKFAVKFLNKIFRRTHNERKLREAVKMSGTCKNNNNSNPTGGYQSNPYVNYPTPQTDGRSLTQTALFQPPPPVGPTPKQLQAAEEAEEAATIEELNAMLDAISRDINTISPEYLTLVTPLFGTLVELKGRDFRKTDNRDIFRKVDDYQALIKCDTHICLESVMSRLQSLVEFINVIKADSENLRKFPRIITKCYETESKMCQEVCEVYSNDEFQTVNIKKMCKLKPKPPERPPWRLTYKIGDECFGTGKVQANTCAAPAPAPVKTCPLLAPGRGLGAKKSCGSKSYTTTGYASTCCSSLGSTTPIRRYRSLYSANQPCPCGCCDSTDKIPNICGIYFTRFRDLKEEDCPLRVEGHATNEFFPSVTNFDNKRELNLPSQRLFLQEPKCCNPPPVEDCCFGGRGHRWKKKFPCGARNACCKESCGSGRRRRRRRTCRRRNRRKSSVLAECQTSDFDLQQMPLPPGGGGSPTGGGIGDISKLTPAEFSSKMVGMFGRAVQEGEDPLGYGGVTTKDVADLARGLFGGEKGPGTGAGKQSGYVMSGMVATQTMLPPGARPTQQRQQQQQSQLDKNTYIVQMLQEMQRQRQTPGHQTQVPCQQPEPESRSRSCLHKQAQTFNPNSIKKKCSGLLPLKFSTDLNCKDSPCSQPSCESSNPQNNNHHTYESLNHLNKTLRMSNDQLAGLLAKLLVPSHAPASSSCSSNSQQIFTNFVAQMCAAGNISKDEATRMSGLICNGLPCRRHPDDEDGGGGGGSRRLVDTRPQSAHKGAQCTSSQIDNMTTSQARLNCSPSKLDRHIHICGPEDGCQSMSTLQEVGPRSIFTSTQVYTSASGTQLQHTRSYHGAGGAFSQTMLCITASKPSVQGLPRCDSQNRPICMTKSKGSVRGIPPCNSQMRPACTTKSKPSAYGMDRCQSRQQSRRDVCVTKSQPSFAGFPRCPSATESRPCCTTKSKPRIPGVFQCKSKPRCIPAAQPSVPGYPRCAPALPLMDEPEEPIYDDESDHGGGDEPPPLEDVPAPPSPEKVEEEEEEVVEEEEEEEEKEPTPKSSPKTSVATPKTEKTPTKSKSEHESDPLTTPPMSDTPSPQASPVLSYHTPSPQTERSASITSRSRSPSLPPEEEEETTEEELEWPSTPPRGPLEKRPSYRSELPPPPRPKPGRNYQSPFKCPKIRPPEVPCEAVLCGLPECHPLKTPYPPQYRFDEVRMRRYMEQCHQLKKICAHPQGEQCWTPPPPPCPTEQRERKPPFPPDRCHPPLFPGTNLGMGCSYGLPSGNCYGTYEKGRRAKKPADDCYFDCGGICPMHHLGETCPQQPPPYSKLKKKAKKDEVFQFNYITVMREKAGPPESEGTYCDQLKAQRRLEEREMMEGAAAAEQCPPVEECPVECPPRRGRRRRSSRSSGREGSCVPNGYDPYGPPPPSHEIARFLNRPDVQVVKEQKTEIVKTQGMAGQEKLVNQTEAYYTKTPDGRIATELTDGSNNSPHAATVDQWMRQDADATLRKHNRGHRFTDECPVLETEWEKEFKEFAKSCGRTKHKRQQKPLPPGFIPCPLPETTTVMCRVPDPSCMKPGGNNVIQCQAVPLPMGNVGNAMQFGTEGMCVGGGGGGYRGANGMAGLSFLAPPVGYGGCVLQQSAPVQQQPNQTCGPPSQQSQQTYQALISGFPGGVLPPPPQQQYQQQMYSQPMSQLGSSQRSQQESHQMYMSQMGSQQRSQQEHQQMESQRPYQEQQQTGSQRSHQEQQQAGSQRSHREQQQAGSQGSQQQTGSQRSHQEQQQMGSQRSHQESQQVYSQQRSQQQQRTSWDADTPPPVPNGYQRYAPGQPVFGSERMTEEVVQEEERRTSYGAPPSTQPPPSSTLPPPSLTQPGSSSDYPYMCEIRYHEPIHGSIYGKVVTRKQPCRLMDPNTVIPPGHNPNCPVIMETPFFNPSCRQKDRCEEQQLPAPRCEIRKSK